MIGRAAELATILGQVDAMCALRHERNVVFVTGEAGSGKTTLLRAVAEQAARRPGAPLVAVTECSTPLLGQDVGQAEALKPWAELLEDILRHDAEPERRDQLVKLVSHVAIAWTHCIPFVGGILHSSIETAMLVREHRQHGEEQQAANQEQMFQQYINFLGRACEAHPIVLVLDDFHWADTSSTNLLFSAARRLAGRRVLFVIAYRADDALSSRGGRGHPLLHVRNELGRYSLTLDVVVPRLQTDDLEALLHARYSRYQENRGFERWLVERSGGNALFITQYLNTLEEDGILSPQTGELRERFDSVRVPGSAASVVEERIRRLDDDARELLRYASVEGATFTAAVLASLTELPRLKLLSRLRQLAEKHGVIGSLGKQLIYASESTAYQFSNALMQRVLYESLEDEERDELHARVYASIKADFEAAADVSASIVGLAVRLAAHARGPADRHFAARLLLEAARTSWARRAEEETLGLLASLERHLEALEAGRLVHGIPDQRELRELQAGARLMAGKVDKFRGRYLQAVEHFRAARAILDALPGAEQRALEPMMREAFSLENARRYREAEDASRATLARAEKLGDDRVRGAMLNNLGLAATALGRVEEGLEHQRQSLELRERAGDRVGQAVSLGSMGLALFSAGRLDDALDHHRRALALREALGDRVGQGYSLANIGNVLAASERLDEALLYYRRSVEVREACGDVVRQAESLASEARLLLRLGREAEAGERFGQVLRLREALGDRRGEAAALVELGALLRAQGDLPRCRRLLERALRLAEEQGEEATAADLRAQLEGLPPAPAEPPPVAPAPPGAAVAPVAVARSLASDGLTWLLRAALWLHARVEDRLES